jgi:hypothetical protein
MQTSISLLARDELDAPTLNAAMGLLFGGLATVLILAGLAFSPLPKAAHARSESQRLADERGDVADAENARIKKFMERIALSHVAIVWSSASVVAAADADKSGPPVSTSDRASPR